MFDATVKELKTTVKKETHNNSSGACRNPEADSVFQLVDRFEISKNPFIAELSDVNGCLNKLLVIDNWIPACAGMTNNYLFRTVVGMCRNDKILKGRIEQLHSYFIQILSPPQEYFLASTRGAQPSPGGRGGVNEPA